MQTYFYGNKQNRVKMEIWGLKKQWRKYSNPFFHCWMKGQKSPKNQNIYTVVKKKGLRMWIQKFILSKSLNT